MRPLCRENDYVITPEVERTKNKNPTTILIQEYCVYKNEILAALGQ